MYVSLKTTTDLTDYTTLERNSLLEWQWVKEEKYFLMQYPVDIDILTFDAIAPNDKKATIMMTIDNMNECSIENLSYEIAHLLWSKVFLNQNDSYLCNRNRSSESSDALFYIFMVWIGYDLSCSDNKNNVLPNFKYGGHTEITIFCIILSMFYPLIFSLIELPSIMTKINELNNKFHIEDLTDYKERDAPFSLQRAILKLFFVVKIEILKPNAGIETDEKGNRDNIGSRDNGEDQGRADEGTRMSKEYLTNIAACRFTLLYCIFLTVTSALRFGYSREDHIEYDDVYRLGVPFINSSDLYGLNCFVYFFLLFLGVIFLKACYITIIFKDNKESSVHEASSGKQTEPRNRNKDIQIASSGSRDVVHGTSSENRNVDIVNTTPGNSEGKSKNNFFENVLLLCTFFTKFTCTSGRNGYQPIDGDDSSTQTTNSGTCTRQVSDFVIITKDSNSHGFFSQFIDRFFAVFSYSYWNALLKNIKYCCFTCCSCMCKSDRCKKDCNIPEFCKCKQLRDGFNKFCNFCYRKCLEFKTSPRDCCKKIWQSCPSCRPKSDNTTRKCDSCKLFCCATTEVMVNIVLTLVNILTSICPLMWIFFYCPFYLAKNVQNSLIKCVFVFINFVLLLLTQWILVCANIFVLRSVCFLLFVALSSSHHHLRLFIIIAIALGYISSFAYRFITEYSVILKVIFREIRKLQPDRTTISEAEFDQIIEKVFNSRQRVFIFASKTFLSVGFFIIAYGILFQNEAIDDTGAEYLIKLAFIAVSPKALFDFLEYNKDDFEASIDEKRSLLQDELREYSSTKTLNEQCCSCKEKCTFCAGCCQTCNMCCLGTCDDYCPYCICPVLSTFCFCKITCDGETDVKIEGTQIKQPSVKDETHEKQLLLPEETDEKGILTTDETRKK